MPLIVTHSAMLLLGYVVSRLVRDIPGVEIDRTVDPVSLSALLLTLVVSGAFYHRMERGKYGDQLRKDAALRHLSEVRQRLSELEQILQRGVIVYHEVVRAVTLCRKEFSRYCECADELAFEVNAVVLRDYHLVCADLKNYLTDTPLQGAIGGSALTVVDGALEIARDRRVEVETKLAEGRRLLFKIEVAVISKV